MKTIATNPTTVVAGQLDLIRDSTDSTPPGNSVNELVGGRALQTLEDLDWAREEAHWRENHASQDFSLGLAYADFSPAYRLGSEGYARHGVVGRTFDETETELRERYETENGSPKLPWTIVRSASQAAWARADSRNS